MSMDGVNYIRANCPNLVYQRLYRFRPCVSGMCALDDEYRFIILSEHVELSRGVIADGYREISIKV